MRKLLLGALLALAACSDDPPAYEPVITGLPAEAFAGAAVALVLDPLPLAGSDVEVTVEGSVVVAVLTDSAVTFVIPDSLAGVTAIDLSFDGHSVWSSSLTVAGFAGATEASAWVGAVWWNLVTTQKSGLFQVWGRLSDGDLGVLSPSTGSVGRFADLMSVPGLRVPGPAVIAGQYLVAPAAAVAVDSFEIWQFLPFVQKVGRVPRHGAERQAAMLDGDRWLLTGAHGAWTYDAAADSILYSGTHQYEEPQVIFRSPKGDRTTISFHGGSLGTPVFGVNGIPVFHIQGMRGVHGVAFSPDSATMVMVGYSQDYSDLLMEVVLEDGTRVDSLVLDFTPRAVGMDTFGRVYVMGEGPSERPFVEVYQRPGYQKIGRMQAPAGVRPCAFGCIDGVLGFDVLARLVYAVDAADPSYVGGNGNGIWTFRMPMGAPAATHRVRLR